MGQPVRGPGQLIQVPIQRNFGPSCVRQVYFICKSTEFHDIPKKCQIIKTFHLFITLIIIYHKLPAIDRLLAPRSLSNRSLVCRSCAVELLPCLRGFKIETRFKEILSWYHSVLCERTISLNIYQYDLVSPTHQMFFLPCGVQGDLLVHIPPYKGKRSKLTLS